MPACVSTERGRRKKAGEEGNFNFHPSFFSSSSAGFTRGSRSAPAVCHHQQPALSLLQKTDGEREKTARPFSFFLPFAPLFLSSPFTAERPPPSEAPGAAFSLST